MAFVAQYIAGTEVKMDPISLEEAMKRPEADQWCSAVQKEYTQLFDKQTWNLQKRSTLPSGYRPLTGKLVFKTKRDQNGNILKY